jgi:hypothetical protein
MVQFQISEPLFDSEYCGVGASPTGPSSVSERLFRVLPRIGRYLGVSGRVTRDNAG